MSLDKQIGTVFTVIGILLVVFSTSVWQKYSSLADHGIRAQAKVLDTIRDTGSRGAYHLVLGWRLWDGRYATHRQVEAANFGPQEGDTVEIAYDRKNPCDLVLVNNARSLFVPAVTSFLGGIFSFLGIVTLVAMQRRLAEAAVLRKNGMLVEAEFVSLTADTSRSYNGVNPWKLVVSGVNQVTGRNHYFESEPVWKDPTLYVNNRSIDVFINPHNPQRYFVDLSFLSERFFQFRA